MSNKFIIEGCLPSLNEYTNANRTNKYAGAKLKKQATQLVVLYAKTQLQGEYEQIELCITYYCKNKRKDPDNVAFAKKFILDGLQESGHLKNDGWNNILGWSERFEIDKDRPRIEVEIKKLK